MKHNFAKQERTIINFCSRRDFLKVLTISAMFTWLFPACTHSIDQSNQDDYSDVEATDQWMTSWIRRSKVPIGSLHLSRFADPIYFLTKKIGWYPNPDQKKDYPTVIVPVGFVTDFASIPRVFWSSFRPDGIYTYPAIIHDYLYWTQTVPRETADNIFKLAMEDFQIDRATISIIYSCVRVGGGKAWVNNARLKAAGEKRILKRFPEDPIIRWKEWKAMPDVFY